MNTVTWPRSMGAQVFLILFLGVTLSAGLALTISNLERRQSALYARELRLADRVADLKSAFDAAPPELRPALLGPGPEAPRLVPPSAVAGELDGALTQRLRHQAGLGQVEAFSPGGLGCRPSPPLPPPGSPPPPPPPRSPNLGGPPPPPDCRVVRMTLKSGEQLALVFPMGPRTPALDDRPLTPLYIAILSMAAALLAYLVARLSTAPLRRLAAAAAALGKDLDRAPLPVEGPLEVRQAAGAFNAMQVRLRAHLEERTYMLAAITHDLQTPMTRQRLRLEQVADKRLRDQLLADHADMVELIEHGLELARLSGEAEPLVELDIDSLLQTLSDDAFSSAGRVTITGRCGLVVKTRPLALQRCLSNLIDNALKYAGDAELTAAKGEGICIAVLDRGPGIPADELTAVLQPFYRREPSRSRQTGGTGLGLTIAKAMAERAGASLSLTNRSKGGIRAELRFIGNV